MIRNTISIFCYLFLFAGPSFANCFSGLQRTKQSGYQPLLTCPVELIHKCFAQPPLLLLLSVPAVDLSNAFAQVNSLQERYSFLASLVNKTADTKRYWRYLCTAIDTSQSSPFDCFDPVSSDLLFDNIPAYKSGIFFPSAVEDLRFNEYNKSELPGYIAEYICHPSDPNLVQLRQFHVGPSVRSYYRGLQPLFKNPTGNYSIVLRITTFELGRFIQQKSNKPKLGFSMDPSSIAPIVDKFVPDSMR